MKKTKTTTNDIEILRTREAVTDKELALILGMGLAYARKLATQAGAVFYIGKTKRNNMHKIRSYIDTISGC